MIVWLFKYLYLKKFLAIQQYSELLEDIYMCLCARA